MTMRNHSRKRLGGFVRPKRLTEEPAVLYTVIAVNKRTGTITTIGQISSVEEATQLKAENRLSDCQYYILEDTSVLLELE